MLGFRRLSRLAFWQGMIIVITKACGVQWIANYKELNRRAHHGYTTKKEKIDGKD
jgi:hypothetical protein